MADIDENEMDVSHDSVVAGEEIMQQDNETLTATEQLYSPTKSIQVNRSKDKENISARWE